MSSLFDRDRSAERLPVSLITGFLGSGKTTLLNRLLRRPDMADSAVIINEFGEVPPFSRVLIETSGLADPAPVVQLFLNNPLLGHDLRLDTVVTMVDGAGG